MFERYYPANGETAPAACAQRETFWRRLIARWEISGLAKGPFIERERVSGASLRWWLRELDRRDDSRRPIQGIPMI